VITDVIMPGAAERLAKDGRRLQISMTVSPIRDSSGSIIGASKVARDITEQRRVEERLCESQKLENIGQLAAGIAQDFNNLLTVILGNAELALQMLPPAHPAERLAKAVVHSSETAAQLTRRMLAYAGKAQLVQDLVDLSDLVRNISGRIRSSLPKNVELQLDLESPLPPIKGEIAELEDFVMNLVNFHIKCDWQRFAPN
jgi:signal transduction histidine kinase